MFTRTVMDLYYYSIGNVCGRLHLFFFFHALLPSRRHIKTNVWTLLIVSPILRFCYFAKNQKVLFQIFQITEGQFLKQGII